MQPPRINVGKLLRRFVISLVLPFGAAVVIDQLMGTAPLLTVAALVICLPLATVVVSRTALREMGRVIDEATETTSPVGESSGADDRTRAIRPN